MHLELLVEEQSAEVALKELLPKLVSEGTTYNFHTFQGKPDLLQKLPDRLRGYRHWLPADARIVVLLDEDREDCRALKEKMELAASQAGLTTKTGSPARFQVVNRLAIEELEAWFFGDVPALLQAYPKIPATLGEKAKYREPDQIAGGTWESLERVLQQAGYYPSGIAKIEVARNVARHMSPARNRSKSFKTFAETLTAMTAR